MNTFIFCCILLTYSDVEASFTAFGSKYTELEVKQRGECGDVILATSISHARDFILKTAKWKLEIYLENEYEIYQQLGAVSMEIEDFEPNELFPTVLGDKGETDFNYKEDGEDTELVIQMDVLGENLESYLIKDRRDASHPERRIEILEFGKQIWVIFGVVHGNEITHRDVKPENFLLGLIGSKREKNVHLADFAFSYYAKGSFTKELKKENSGTMLYLPLAQHKKNCAISTKLDVESFIIMFYCMMSGKELPWEDDTEEYNKSAKKFAALQKEYFELSGASPKKVEQKQKTLTVAEADVVKLAKIIERKKEYFREHLDSTDVRQDLGSALCDTLIKALRYARGPDVEVTDYAEFVDAFGMEQMRMTKVLSRSRSILSGNLSRVEENLTSTLICV